MEDNIKCPECNGNNLKKFGKKWVKYWIEGDDKRHLKQQYQCKECGRITINPKENKKCQ